MQGAAITWNLFPILGVQPILGRHFREDDDRPGAEPVVMLSHEVWQRRYHGDPAVVGRSITVNGTAAHRRRRDAAEIQFSRNAEGLDSARAGRRNRQTRFAVICSRSAA